MLLTNTENHLKREISFQPHRVLMWATKHGVLASVELGNEECNLPNKAWVVAQPIWAKPMQMTKQFAKHGSDVVFPRPCP